ncbi:hypothetical protein ACE38W_05460 [Chitinophaga sp. Hz27]|uniref:hypothetical protein n=1 Tax=Chitinophaga sp. Hz27 TaxID=3347169 RepID=UPI0035D5C8AF
MVPQTQSFPYFEANQVLTSDQLNLLFEYNDEQNRLTRTNLIGIGIVCGLEAAKSTDGTSITITRGCGVTSAGYLVVLDPDTTYTYRKDYKQPDPVKYDVFIHKDNSNNDVQIPLWELLTAMPPNNSDSSITTLDNNFLADKVVMLFVELNQTENKNCLPNSCDDKGATVNITIQPLLIKTSDIDTYLKTNIPAYTGKLNLVTLKMPRLDITATSLTTTANLVNAYKTVLTKDFIQKTVKQTLLTLVNTYKTIHPDISKLGQALNRLDTFTYDAGGKIDLTREYYYQYYYDFISDLMEGYTEIITKYARVMATCCPDESWFPRHLFLNQLSGATNPDAYRHYFIPSPAIAKDTQLSGELVQYFNRLTTMLYAFPNILAPTIYDAPSIQITPSKLGAPLSEKAIPFYYVQTKQTNGLQLFNTWNYKIAQQGKNKQILSYNSFTYPATDDFVLNPLKYDLEPFNFFRIEGIVGTDYKKTLDTLSAMRNNFRLPFNIVGIRTGNIGDDTATAYFPNLEADYQQLKAAIVCAGIDLLNSVTALGNLTNAVITAVTQRNTCLGKELYALWQVYNSRFSDFQQKLMLSQYGANNPGITHKGGVPPGGTFVVVYDGAYQYKYWQPGDIIYQQGDKYTLSDSVMQLVNSNPGLKYMTDNLMGSITAENADMLIPIITQNINNAQVVNTKPSVDMTNPRMAMMNMDTSKVADTSKVVDTGNVADTSKVADASKIVDTHKVVDTTNIVSSGVATGVATGHPFNPGSFENPGFIGIPHTPVAVTNGIIIADFYLPYICCADGGVSQYTVNETPPPPPATCTKPCNGIVQQCLYPLWMPMVNAATPTSEPIANVDIAYLTIRDDNGAVIYDDDFSSAFRGQLLKKPLTMDSVGFILKTITTSLQANLKDTDAFTINYLDPTNGAGTVLLQLSTYQCYTFELRISMETITTYYDYTYNNTGANASIRYSPNSTANKLGFQEYNARIPKFGCIITDRCQNKVITDICQISGFKIKPQGSTYTGPETVPNFKSVYWIADRAMPAFGTDQKYQLTAAMINKGNLRAIVIDTKGCWAVDETTYTQG